MIPYHKKVYTLAIGLLLSASVLGQDLDNRVYLDSSNYTYAFYTTTQRPKVKTGQTYTWYKAGAILTTYEGYDGKLLDGEFKMFYPNKNLYRWGWYKKGHKTGLWREWSSDGILLNAVRWVDGRPR